jgi:hypothetical protein
VLRLAHSDYIGIEKLSCSVTLGSSVHKGLLCEAQSVSTTSLATACSFNNRSASALVLTSVQPLPAADMKILVPTPVPFSMGC